MTTTDDIDGSTDAAHTLDSPAESRPPVSVLGTPRHTDRRGTELALRSRHTPADLEQVGDLFDEYVLWNIEHVGASPLDAQPTARTERANLRDAYAWPNALITAHAGDQLVGMAGLLLVPPAGAELKRCYVRPAARGRAAGRRLVEAALDHARTAGATTVHLDTFPDVMPHAVALYQALGFRTTTTTRLPGIAFDLHTMTLNLQGRNS